MAVKYDPILHKKRELDTAVTTVGSSQSDHVTDGTADDVQIQAALDAVNTAGGGIVYIRAGTYDIQSPLTIGDKTTVYGDGWATILKHAAGAGFNGLLTNKDQTDGNPGNTGIHIRDLAVDGNRTNVTGSDPRDTIFLRNVKKSVVEHVYIYEAVDSAIVIDETTNNNSNNNRVINNFIDGATDIGIYVSNAGENDVDNNTVLNTGSYGIRVVRTVAGKSTKSTVKNNRVYNCGQTASVDGIIADTSDNTIIADNKVIQAGRYGIQLTSSAYCSVTGNNVELSDLHGIYLNGAVRGTIASNTVHRNGQTASNTYSGIYLNNASQCNIVGNRCGDIGSGTRQKYGVEEAGSSDTNVFVGNMLQINGTAGLLKIGAASIAFGNSNYSYNSIIGRMLGNQGADVASANNLALGSDGNVFEITGTTQINLISNLNWQNGSEVTLLFTSTPTVKHNQATSSTNITIQLAGAVDFVASAGDTLKLVLSEIGGTQAWREVSRAVI